MVSKSSMRENNQSAARSASPWVCFNPNRTCSAVKKPYISTKFCTTASSSSSSSRSAALVVWLVLLLAAAAAAWVDEEAAAAAGVVAGWYRLAMDH
ncbi:hypothetical protein ACA910_003347 [Epithemia clementina (nom. ined.)]